MASISSPGIGSGLDITDLVGQIIEAEREPTQLRLDSREAEYQAELTSFGVVKGALSDFQSTLKNMRSLTSLSSFKATSSDQDAVSVSVGSLATEGNYSVEVVSLAKAHTLSTNSEYTSLSDTVGTGDLTFTFGTSTAFDDKGNADPADDTPYSFSVNSDRAAKTVTITDGSLQGVRDAVNAANIGVTASIVDTGGNKFKLLFTSDDAGAKNGLEISGDAGLSDLFYNGTDTQNMTETQAGTDASVKFNGLTVTRESNKVTDLIKGVTLDLKSVSQNGASTIDISRQEGDLAERAQAFVDGYNQTIAAINGLTGFDTATGQAGILLGDSTVRSITTQIRRALFESIPSVGNTYNSLASIGIRTQANGTLGIDSAQLDAAIEADSSAVARVFAVGGEASSENLTYVFGSPETEPGIHQVNITQPATQGTFTGGQNTNLVVDANNKTFSISVDGSTTAVTLTEGTYTDGDALAAEIQAQINSSSTFSGSDIAVSVAFDTDHFVITSNLYGSSSKVSITDGDAALGLTGTSVDGLDVAGSIAGAAATGEGQFLTATGGAGDGLKVQYTGTGTGVVGGITFARGYADKLNNIIDRFLEGDGLLETKTEGLESNIEDVAEQRIKLNDRLENMQTQLLRQFTNMDILVSQLQQTSDFLTQQLATLPTVQVRRSGQ